MTDEPIALEVASDFVATDAAAATTVPVPQPPVSQPPVSQPSVQPIRVDRWLWAARFFKTRSQANKACVAGNVKVNEQTVKASKMVRPGDEVDVETKGGRRLVDVVALADKRGSATVAQTLYHDRTPPPPPREEGGAFGERERGAGRPEKRDRRLLIRLRGR